MSVSSPARACACSATAQAQLATELAATQLQSALLQAITGLTQLVTQLAAQLSGDSENWARGDTKTAPPDGPFLRQQ